MGNSGSIQNVAIGLEEAQYPRHYHPQIHLNQHDPSPSHHQQNFQHHHYPLHWTASYSSNGSSSGPQSHPHIKVLPPEPTKLSHLRPTINGNILQSGGTLSGRKDSFNPTLLLQRSRTTLTESPGFVQRTAARQSGEQIRSSRSIKPQLIPANSVSGILNSRDCTDATRNPTTKRFGSEPDLRGNIDEENERNSPAVNNSANAHLPPQSKSKVVKSKKRMAPHPLINNDVNMSTIISNGGQIQRKLRLFKTKAESRKIGTDRTTLNSSKLAPEASDYHLRRFDSPEQVSSSSRRYLPGRVEQESNKQHDNEVKSIVPPVFRREKSFDITLLRNRNNDHQQSLGNTAVTSPTVLPGKFPVFRQRSIDNSDAIKNTHMSTFDPKLSRLRKYSQPSTVLPFGHNFKAKLETDAKQQPLAIIDNIDDNEARISSSQKPGSRSETSKARSWSKKSPQLPAKQLASVKNEGMFAQRQANQSNNQNEKAGTSSKIPQLTKTFYFGMEKLQNDESLTDMPNQTIESENFAKIQMEVIDQFAKSIFTTPQYQCAESESSESALSSEERCHVIHETGINNVSYDDENNLSEIQAHIRPTLPRRQLEIPRFSPAAAWRTLNEDRPFLMTHNANDGLSVDLVQPVQSTQPLEGRIQRNYREPNPIYPDNKSGDSGISGDAGLPERVDSPKNQRLVSTKVGPFLSAWTPQQDLDEDEEETNTSSDGETKLGATTNKYPSHGHTFSLSLPRENQLSLYEEKEKPSFSSLQKLKRTVSGVFASPSNSSNNRLTSNYRNDNWLLSRSAPNSMDNPEIATTILTSQLNSGNAQENAQQSSALSYFTAGKHVMYLPNQPIEEPETDFKSKGVIAVASTLALPLNTSTSSPAKDDTKTTANNWLNTSEWKQSEENSNNEEHNLQNLTFIDAIDSAKVTNNRKNRVGHRFTFQSTVRQIERRRIADKLSKEAEQKEAQRISELEAMRRVEEEFQRKRAGEKASIRHQLHLFSLEESQCISLPVDWQNHTTINSYSSNTPEQAILHSHNSHRTQQQRAEPDGAVSSSPASSPILRSHSKARINSITPISGADTNNINGVKTSSSQYLRKDDTSKFPKINARMRQQQQTEILSEFQMPRREYFEYRSPPANFRKVGHQQQQKTGHHEIVYKTTLLSSQQQGSEQYFYNTDQIGNVGYHPHHYHAPDSEYSAQQKSSGSQSPPL